MRGGATVARAERRRNEVQGSDACLDSIERAMSAASSPLSRALRDLGSRIGNRGVCLLIEHEELGETLIADRNWAWDRADTLRNRDHFTLVDLRQDQDFRRFAVLVEPLGAEAELDEKGMQLTLAALGVTRALAEIAGSFEGMAPAGMETGVPPRAQAV
jgi:hypothetical protein